MLAMRNCGECLLFSVDRPQAAVWQRPVLSAWIWWHWRWAGTSGDVGLDFAEAVWGDQR